ncbi:glutamate-ammonia-ligase adenylyltransferase [Bisgaardia hudsonensis]|uniref:Bifunctional glutamine synthetase adenylyltransferase/adenylyl-removing enzyme n=1 Tax=Bisgaardia hudsonensis TaxID=109472 RepID=A0A4R2N2L1_9PAST|nr:bifunctional [glutamate--ammonia ligase]-adenylyl-L-tyrosine phosphorylase/[glutamate--ammonia-ligase] adenylyltransferase [Bisgaardia hudsonensis]QLB12557.1 bifunctional glutamine synthetase adenylyltransferase/deadenyltransferase [Bisgaardia hudsonensis]TCP14098.1 glutamate-ammonia-ligase adenylyltransferase [Bisgaardia hudsonensis]
MLQTAPFIDTLHSLAKLLVTNFPEKYDDDIERYVNQELKLPNSHINQLLLAISMSDFLSEVFQKQPHFLDQCWQKLPTLGDCDNYKLRLNQQLQVIETEQQLFKILRQFRNQEMAKLSICQTLNLGSVEDIFIRLSRLAETLIIGARDWLYEKTCQEMGTPIDSQGNRQQLYILGMGKLGGSELNFSSDIDLIFTYPENGETIGGRRSVENHKFFTRLGQRIIQALDQYTDDGFVYRTDMRLRPFGDSGALALSFNAMELYYQEQGRDWERYAMIKGRILGADPQDQNVKLLQNLLRPFIYRRYIDFSVIQSLRDMKEKITREVRRRGLVDNIKLGAGGIREIEFIVQVFQLIRGGREIGLQHYELLKILPEIERLQLITPQQREDLQQAYLFLRRTENILQAINDKQTQQLPTNELDQQRLITACAEFTQWDNQKQNITITYPINDWQSFYTVLQTHHQKVRSVFDNLIGENDDEEKNQETDIWNDFLDEDLVPQEIEQILITQGIQENTQEEIIDRLYQFKMDLARRSIGVRGRLALTQLIPNVLKQIFSNHQFQALLPRILNIIDKIATRTTYLELLVENPQVLTQLIELCAKSKMIAEQVARHPILLDELLNRKALLNPIPYTDYSSELQQYLLRLPNDDEEQLIDALRQFKQTILLQVAAADILGALPVMKVSDHLTFLAEAIINVVVNTAWQQVSQRFGVPEYLTENEKGFLVIGYGKLGGIELGYKSDLDLVFLYDGTRTGQTIGGRKSIDSKQFYLKLAQKIISIFSINTSAGVLYEIDLRLRPSGDSGLLGCSLKAFENYQTNDAWTWEKQALVRARVVYGEQHLRQRFDLIREKVLTTPRELTQLKLDITAMREKMYQHLSHSKENEFNIKTDLGGITDIEFIAQYLVLAHAPKNALLTTWSDNVRIFEIMTESAVISEEVSEKLKECYTKLRNRIHHLNLLGLPSVTTIEEFKQEREFIREVWGNLLY